MAENSDSASPPSALGFERAEFDVSASPTCASCQHPITDGYYTLGPNIMCQRCRSGVAAAMRTGNRFTRMLGAVLLGAVAAAVGCALWMVVTKITGYEIGLIAIAVGFLVGHAVHVGSRRIGGVFYQLIAIFLTYTAIVMTYVPNMAEELIGSEQITAAIAESDESKQAATEASVIVAAWAVAIPLSYAVPFMLGFENAIGILIIGFAVWQAWKMNAAVALDWQGPFRLGNETAGGG